MKLFNNSRLQTHRTVDFTIGNHLVAEGISLFCLLQCKTGSGAFC